MNKSFYRKLLFPSILLVFLLLKLLLGTLLKAENGDTYNFFQMAEAFRNHNYLFESKRMPLFPLLLSLVNPSYFSIFGRILVNLFYFASIYIFYKLSNIYLKNSYFSILTTVLFSTNMILLDNSFYVMSDMLFTFLFLSFLYLYKMYEKKLDAQRTIILTLISILAFYTRIEGILLSLSLIVYLVIKNKFKSNKQIILVINFMVIGLLPIILKSYLLFGTLFHSSYFSDKAGFNLNFKNIYMGFSLLLFSIGGFWLLPFLLNFKLKRIINLEVCIYALFSSLLVFWGPYIRLYSVPAILTIIFVMRILQNAKSRPNLFKYVIGSVFAILLYLISVQYFDQRDLGMFKISKIITFLFSSASIYALFVFQKIRNKTYILLFVCFVSIINISVFVERFIATRCKYFTIVQASEFYVDNLLPKERKIAYSDESGVEKWHLRDYYPVEYTNSFDTTKEIEQWININNIAYFISTEEMGDNSKSEKLLKNYLKKYPVSEEFTSTYYGGNTKIYNVGVK